MTPRASSVARGSITTIQIATRFTGVGQRKDAEDWQRFQPGPANGLAGGRLHPFTILFNLSSPPRGVCRLKIGILYEIPRLSYLQASVNGHTGFFYFHPKLNYAAGDWEGTYAPQTSTDSKTIEFPAAWLHLGENRLVLTALDDPPTPEIGAGAIGTGHTALIYDALELTQDAQARYDSKRVQASALPTIFYRNAPSGLAEVVEVYADFATGPTKRKRNCGSAAIRIASPPLSAGSLVNSELNSKFRSGAARLRPCWPSVTGNRSAAFPLS